MRRPKRAAEDRAGASVGVNSPPDAPLPRHRAVTSGLRANSGSIRPIAAEPEERVVRHVQAVAEELRIPDADDAEDAEGYSGMNSTLVPLARKCDTHPMSRT